MRPYPKGGTLGGAWLDFTWEAEVCDPSYETLALSTTHGVLSLTEQALMMRHCNRRQSVLTFLTAARLVRGTGCSPSVGMPISRAIAA